MVAKDEAKELVNRFSKLDKGLNEKEWKGKDVSFEEFHRQCALICVDEMLKLAYNIEWEKKKDAVSKVKFIKEFKEEIKKL